LGRTNHADLTRGSILIEAAQGTQVNRATETNPRLSTRTEAPAAKDRPANHRHRFFASGSLSRHTLGENGQRSASMASRLLLSVPSRPPENPHPARRSVSTAAALPLPPVVRPFCRGK
jgi:hypothetical protein